MKTVLLLVIFILSRTPNSLEECQKVQNSENVPSYQCNDLQDLQQDQPKIKGGLHMKVILIQDSTNGFNLEILNSLRNLSEFLQHNYKLKVITSGLLHNLPITYLSINDNEISAIENGAFSNLEILEELFIVNNRLNIINYGIFNNLPITTLALSNNRITLISNNAFANMKNLKRLYLDGNLISFFQPETYITYKDTLHILWLQGNAFKVIDKNMFNGLNNLRELNIGYNPISKIFPGTFSNLENLETLELSNTLLEKLDENVFPIYGMKKLIKLYIHDNQLTYLTPSVLNKWENLKYIRLGGNPWLCSCLDEILVWMGERKIQAKCDLDYFTGLRPVCVTISNDYPDTCNYESNAFYYSRYSDTNKKIPAIPECML